jgi:hypothetical protein
MDDGEVGNNRGEIVEDYLYKFVNAKLPCVIPTISIRPAFLYANHTHILLILAQIGNYIHLKYGRPIFVPLTTGQP